MIRLNRNVTLKSGQYFSGQAVDGQLPKEIIDDLLKTGWADEVDEPVQDAQDNGGNEDGDYLSGLKVPKLKQMAKGLKIDGYDSMTKADLIAAIEQKEAESSADETNQQEEGDQ